SIMSGSGGCGKRIIGSAPRPSKRHQPLESRDEYRAFEAAILTEYLPQTPVEQELVRRLASLFWRLRRATSIETGLLRMQSEILLAFRSSRQRKAETREQEPSTRCGEANPQPPPPPATAPPDYDPLHPS